MDETVTLAPEPGIDGLPEPKQWQRWRYFLTSSEQTVYLYLRWLATSPSFRGSTTIKHMARDIGDTIDGWKWQSRGTMSQASFKRALTGLQNAGLVEVDEDEW